MAIGRQSAGNDHGKRRNHTELPVRGEEPDGIGPELAKLHEVMTAAGVPAELIPELLQAKDADEALDLLVKSGSLPPMDELLLGMVGGFAPLLEADATALDAELSGAEFLSTLRETAIDLKDVPTLLADLIPAAEASVKPEALAMLRILAVSGPEEIRGAARAAADRMVAGGMKDCRWVSDLGSPRVGACFGYADDAQRSISITFAYGRKRHAVTVLIDYSLGGGVKDCWLSDRPDRLRAQYQKIARREGLDFRDHEPGEARAILERALAERPCPAAPEQIEDVNCYLELLRQRVALLPENGTVPAQATKSRARGRGRTVHRLRIDLRGAQPPIWRRVEVPSSITLQQLHQVIQHAFGWQDYHMWVFETATAAYGQPDPDLGHRSAAAKKLQDAAPDDGSRFSYTYDFGDNWEHEILVEDVLDAEPGVAYPRCVAGRRACPPEDCGGIWGYAELLEVLADPQHEEHEDRLEWLGLESAADFDPAAFDLAAADKALATSARVLVKR